MKTTKICSDVFVQGIPLLGSDGMLAGEERRNKVANVAQYHVHV
jgi:hypothetical protein